MQLVIKGEHFLQIPLSENSSVPAQLAKHAVYAKLTTEAKYKFKLIYI